MGWKEAHSPPDFRLLTADVPALFVFQDYGGYLSTYMLPAGEENQVFACGAALSPLTDFKLYGKHHPRALLQPQMVCPPYPCPVTFSFFPKILPVFCTVCILRTSCKAINPFNSPTAVTNLYPCLEQSPPCLTHPFVRAPPCHPWELPTHPVLSLPSLPINSPCTQCSLLPETTIPPALLEICPMSLKLWHKLNALLASAVFDSEAPVSWYTSDWQVFSLFLFKLQHFLKDTWACTGLITERTR